MSKHNLACSITLLGEEIDVDVEIDVTSWGSSPSWDDPGDPVEFDILSVTSDATGIDYTKYCEKHYDLYRKNPIRDKTTLSDSLSEQINELHISDLLSDLSQGPEDW